MALSPGQKKAAIWTGVVLIAAFLLVLPRFLGGEGETAGGGPGGGGPGGGGGRGGGSDTLAVTTETIRQEPLEDAVTTTGTLLPDEEVEIRAEVAGRITSLGFTEGASVGRGQTLAVLDTQVLDAQVQAARTQAELARVQAQRQRELFAIGGLSRAALDQGEAEAAVARASVAQLSAEVGRRRIVAPFAGQVGLRNVSVGAYVAPGDVLATLRVTSTLKLDFTVPELYLGAVNSGDAVVFTVPGQERTFRAVVYAVEPSVSQETRAFTVRARLANPGGLRPGAFAAVELVLNRAPEALVVPARSVIPGVDSAAVWVVVGGVAERRSVMTGIRTADRVQITGNVRAGETVLTSGTDQVKPGQAVRTTPSR